MIVHDDALCTLHLGDCVEVMRELPADSVDAIVTDPPYGLEFMGKEWDRLGAGFTTGGSERFHNSPPLPAYGKTSSGKMQAWHEAWAREAFRVARPGAHLLAFGGTRTYHRLASAIEDAGWEIRDCLVWAYASGFPKSLDVSKAIDKAAGAERTVATGASYRVPNAATVNPHFIGIAGQRAEGEREIEYAPTAPATPDAQKWDGWGTALKPAWEPIVMARKPLSGTVAANVLAHGTGALNIDATRIGTGGGSAGAGAGAGAVVFADGLNGTRAVPVPGMGRWPANLLLTDPIFDGGVEGVVGGGDAVGGESYDWSRHAGAASFKVGRPESVGYGDSGTYSRFFLIPKSSRSDREPLTRDEAYRLHRESGACDKLPAWRRLDQSPSEPTDSTSPARATSDELSTDDRPSATSLPGKEPTGRSPRVTRSTTSTATSRTTDSATSSSSTRPPTNASTPAASSAMGNGGSPAESADSSSPWEPLTGISPEKDGRPTGDAGPATSARWSSRSSCGDCGKPLPRVSTHPTQKPTDLMRHLVRLVTPPGGTVLDCFLGSGTTAIAANAEGFRCIGIEREREYLDIALARMAHQPLGMAL